MGLVQVGDVLFYIHCGRVCSSVVFRVGNARITFENKIQKAKHNCFVTDSEAYSRLYKILNEMGWIVGITSIKELKEIVDDFIENHPEDML